MTNQAEPGARIGKYRLLSHIATGGMGMVYKALDEALDRVVALKVLAPELTSSPTVVERFRREARHAGKLNHRNIVTLYDFDQDNGTYFLAMEYVQGIDLSTHIARKGRLHPEEARRLVIQAVKALDHAFAQGVTHRDIKPSNFLLSRQGDRIILKMTDLGLARTVNESEFRVTRDGTTVGTVDYMAPEQARDSTAADVRSDIYSLGCTLYQMLTGQPPFAEGGLGERVYKHLAVDPLDVRLLNPEVPDGLWYVLQRMLAKAPEDRYQSPADLMEALKHPPKSPPVFLVPPPQNVPVPTLKVSGASEGPARIKPSISPLAPTLPSLPTAASPASPVPTPPEEARAPAAPPTPPARPTRRRRRTTIAEISLNDKPATELLSAEQIQAAAGQFERANEIIAESGPTDYALQLLLSCCALDPTSLNYRQALREANKQLGPKRSSWLGSLSLSNMSARSKIKAARRAGDHLKVLELGEKYLLRSPEDVSAPIDMAESAEALGQLSLAVWLLEQARQGDTGHTVDRALALAYEKAHLYPQAIALWEIVRKANPDQSEAAEKIRELSVADTIARGNFRRKG